MPNSNEDRCIRLQLIGRLASVMVSYHEIAQSEGMTVWEYASKEADSRLEIGECLCPACRLRDEARVRRGDS